MGAALVHAQGAGQRAAADDRHVRQLQQPLDRAVLPVLAVEDGEGRVKADPAHPVPQQEQLVPVPVRGQGAGGDHGPVLRPAPVADGGRGAAVAKPLAFPGDAHG